ncbi:M3 family metallopeptidase [Rothia kristinae]|uniref:M3 family metallopeptidase n=1 Tax=Rothia kristinae TaxID=37923 RepID=UPI0009E5D69F|nr:M3 family metallopeptidase [Rothia kristinae]
MTPVTPEPPAPSTLLSPSELPGGLPDLSGVGPEDLEELLRAGMAAQRAAWERIAADPAPADFASVVEPLETAAADFARVTGIFFTFVSAMGTEEVLELHRRWAGPLAEHEAASARDPRLARRLAAVEEEGLDPVRRHVLRRWREEFEDRGAFLEEGARQEVARIEQEVAQLSAQFGAGLLAGAEQAGLLLEDERQLAGLPEDRVRQAAEAAQLAGHPGSYLLVQDLFAVPSVLSSLQDRDTRRRLWRDSVNRGRGEARDEGAADTLELLTTAARIAELRARRAELFGARTHAELQLRRSVAGTPQRALGMLEELAPRARAAFQRELAVMAEVAGVEPGQIQPWDVPVLLERVARERYAVDAQALRPYFSFERTLVDGVFAAASRLYGVQFTARPQLPGHHPEVRFWEVRDEQDRLLGLFGLDPWARPTKQGGAWMHEIVPRDARVGQTPVVMNTLNFTRPGQGEEKLLSADNVRTMFHEFGHALHSLLSTVVWPTAAGTNVPRDFVEYPSQVNEMWMFHPEVLPHYARHHETGEPLPTEAARALQEAARWGEGFRTVEYLGAALLDMAWHTRGTDAEPLETPQQVREFEREVLARYGLADLPVAPRYATGMFKHIFEGGYSAGYYSYIFSEMMDAETVDWFRARGGLRRENGQVFRDRLLARGSEQDPAQSFRDLLGRDPQIGPLLRRRGLVDDDAERDGAAGEGAEGTGADE